MPINQIVHIEGIDITYAQQFAAVGLTQIAELLKMGATSKSRQELAAKTGINESLIFGWACMADLMRVQGVGYKYAELLMRSGVTTIGVLKRSKADLLMVKIAEANSIGNPLVKRLPTLRHLDNWIKTAIKLDPLLQG